tara:strand:+ start:187 stop:309 length:123 start_codon:yes stop_codon:yes gene_type:complete
MLQDPEQTLQQQDQVHQKVIMRLEPETQTQKKLEEMTKGL